MQSCSRTLQTLEILLYWVRDKQEQKSFDPAGLFLLAVSVGEHKLLWVCFFFSQLYPDQVGCNLLKKGFFLFVLLHWTIPIQEFCQPNALARVSPSGVDGRHQGGLCPAGFICSLLLLVPSQKSHNGLSWEGRWCLSPQGPGEQRMSTDNTGTLGCCWDWQGKWPGKHILWNEIVGPGFISKLVKTGRAKLPTQYIWGKKKGGIKALALFRGMKGWDGKECVLPWVEKMQKRTDKSKSYW